MTHDRVEQTARAAGGTTRRAMLSAVAGGVAVAGGWLLAPERLEEAEAVEGALGGALEERRAKDQRGRNKQKGLHRMRRRRRRRDRQEPGGLPGSGAPPGADFEITLSNEGRDLQYQLFLAKAELSACYTSSEWRPITGGNELEHRETTVLPPFSVGVAPDQMIVLRVDDVPYFEVLLRDHGDPLLTYGDDASWVQVGDQAVHGRLDRGTVRVDRRPLAENAPATEIKSGSKTYLVRRLANAGQQVRFEIQAKGGRISH